MHNREKIKILCFVTFLLFFSILFGEHLYAGDKQLPPGKSFEILQKQINELNLKFNLLFGQYCQEGEFVAGIDTEGNIICGGPEPAAEIVAYGMGLENHLARSYIKITPENLPQITYIMGCQKSENALQTRIRDE